MEKELTEKLNAISTNLNQLFDCISSSRQKEPGRQLLRYASRLILLSQMMQQFQREILA